MNENKFKHLWKDQPTETLTFSVEEIRKKANAFQRQIAWRNGIEYFAAALVVLCFSFYIWKFPFPLMRIGSVLIIFGSLVVVHQLHKRASRRSMPADSGGTTSSHFYRAELVRQRDALRDVWLWYVAPFIPGMVVFRWGVESELIHQAAGHPHFAKGPVANLSIVLVMLIVLWINRRAAGKLQRKIDQLDQQTQDKN